MSGIAYDFIIICIRLNRELARPFRRRKRE